MGASVPLGTMDLLMFAQSCDTARLTCMIVMFQSHDHKKNIGTSTHHTRLKKPPLNQCWLP